MKLLKITTSVFTVLAAGSSLAADLPARGAPAPYVAAVPLLTWTGFHVGINAGARFGGSSGVSTSGIPLGGDPQFASVPGGGPAFPGLNSAVAAGVTSFVGVPQKTGALIGVQAGYDYQFAGSYLVGIEADVQGVLSSGQKNVFANAATAFTQGGFGAPVAIGTIQTTGVVSRRTDWLGTMRGRFGFSFAPSFLLYVTGGLAYGGVKSSTASFNAVNGGANIPLVPGSITGGGQGGYSTNRVGYTLGGGIEWMFSPSFSLKAEYLYYDLGSASYISGVQTGLSGNPVAAANNTVYANAATRTRLRYDGQIARVGVNYHFWSPVAAPVVARY